MSSLNTETVGKMKVDELKAELKSRGCSFAGKKADLIARLLESMKQDVTEHSSSRSEVDLVGSGVVEDMVNDIFDISTEDIVNTSTVAICENELSKGDKCKINIIS